uniref:Gelsolin-like domain-containing protein n=1 Tax=Acrobeloides nanus TaxID=290746 RepID=A0A914DAV3_9BILA
MRVIENAEPSTFTQWFVQWDSSSGKKSVAFTPKLFQVSNESGKMHVEEIAEFSQEDLDGDDVMMLDVLDQIYVWIGTGANQEERKHAEEAAKKYLATDSIPRPKKASTKVIKQKEESPDFKKYFKTWYSKRSYLQIFVKEPT